jgi:N-methylhydantoinase A/oxoprolinase/acetone carboxylase beta subunit
MIRGAAAGEAPPGPSGAVQVGCDVGGTFTDFVLVDEASGRIVIEKRLTTYPDPSLGTLAGFQALEQAHPGLRGGSRRIAHATTLVANAVIERKGARTALLCTRGFRDVLETRRRVRVTTYELWTDPPEPLVPRYLRFPVTERAYSGGQILTKVDAEEVTLLADRLRLEGVESVAVVFLHAYANAENEAEVGRLLARACPELSVSLSSAVLPQIREFERTSTTVVNAYVKPLVRRYLGNLEFGLQTAGIATPLHVMLSNGGLASVRTASDLPVRLLESGPVAGALVGQRFARLLKLPEVLAFDMGGTTAKACLIRDGTLPMTDELEVARSKRFVKSSGYPVSVPAVQLIEVGAGGGSVASVNALGLVQVGPESAAADPGPMCYGLGGHRPTVTDADLVLGYLDPAYFLGGAMPLDAGAARRGIIDQIAAPLGRDIQEAAWTVHDVVNETMAGAVRMHVVERGGDPARACLVAFGGAGPVHAYNLARKLGIRQVLVPLRAGVLSAFGLLVANPTFDTVRTHKVPLTRLDAPAMADQFREMEREIQRLVMEVAPDGRVAFTRAVDVCYIGQGYQVTLGLDDLDPREADGNELWRRFARVYREKYGYFYEDVPAEVVSLRAAGSVQAASFTLRPLTMPLDPGGNVRKGERPAWAGGLGAMVTHAVYARERLRPGTRIAGPAIVEEPESTAVVGPGAAVEVDGYGTLVITLPEEPT